MTNDNQVPQQPGAYPPPPPGAAPQASPPPPPPPGMASPPPPANTPPAGQPNYTQPPTAAQEPKKKGKGGMIALIVGLLLVCVIGACIGAFLLAGGSGDKDKITQAETHYTAAETALASAESAIESATAGDTTQMAAAIAVATKSVRTARDEIASAKTAAEQFKDSEGKTNYLASLAAATAALDGLENLIAYLDTASGMVGKSNEAGEITTKANADLDDAVELGNKASYSRMRSKAAAASAGYAKATFLFEEADKLDPTAELAKAATYTRKRKEQSDVVIRMADSGKAGRLSAYNSDIKKQAALGKAAMAPGLPAILTDPDWAKNRLAELGKTIMADAEQADTLRKKALEELGYSK